MQILFNIFCNVEFGVKIILKIYDFSRMAGGSVDVDSQFYMDIIGSTIIALASQSPVSIHLIPSTVY